jgi:toluene monooxygenase system protein D
MSDTVGPVLEADAVAHAIVAAIREANRDVEVHDRGAYLRVLVPQRCVVRRDAIERALGRPFQLPGDLEAVMPAFKGTIAITEDEVVWSWRSGR